MTSFFVKPFDPKVYVITDTALSRGRTHKEVVAKAIAGGATCIQLREKNLTTREFFSLAGELRDLTWVNNVTFIINDRLDIALAVEADGVHLGKDDLPIAAARRIIPPGMLLGATVRDVEQAVAAQKDGASYLGAGSVFVTTTKGDTGDPIGLPGLAQISQQVTIPVVGIGGIDSRNVKAVILAGAGGVAVVSAVVSAADIVAATREVADAVSSASGQKRGQNE